MPDSAHEQALRSSGYRQIAGIDEAGRGCWAGPVVAAAVVLPWAALTRPDTLAGIADSKALTAVQRTTAYTSIHALAEGVGVGVVPAYIIDAFGIVPATRLAMTIALLSLPCPVDALLIDALTIPHLSLVQCSILKGDACSWSIASASVVAKVTRDRLMVSADQGYPGYGFAAHKGYGTALHRRMLRQLGPCLLHRMTFRPLLSGDDTDTVL